MKILHVVYTDEGGGASRAVMRLHKSLLINNVDSYVLVQIKKSDSFRVLTSDSVFNKVTFFFRFYLSRLILSLFFKTTNQSLHSLQFFSGSFVKYINKSDFDLVHLHWFQHEMLSVYDITQISKPIVWTLHDMWPFCGCEHVTDTKRHLQGYKSTNRPSFETGLDFNFLIWNLKKKLWRNKFQLIAPSKWMADEASSSPLFNSWPVKIIPNTLNTAIYRPISKLFSRSLLGFKRNEILLLYGAIQGSKYYNKGFDLIEEVFDYLNINYKDLLFQIVVFGQSETKEKSNIPYPIKYMGHIYDDTTLALLYSAADMLIVPSRIESFCQTASEAQSCGTPVVCFDTSGLKTTVKHLETGYLAKCFDVVDFANGILWVLNQDSKSLSRNARNFAVETFDFTIVGKNHIDLYKNIAYK